MKGGKGGSPLLQRPPKITKDHEYLTSPVGRDETQSIQNTPPKVERKGS